MPPHSSILVFNIFGGKAKKEGEKDKSPKRTAVLMQDANLQELKEARPWYQKIDIGVLQLIPARVNESFNKFFIRQRRVSRKQKGSKNRSKAQLRVSKLHNRIQQRRESYQWDVANRIVRKADAVAVEDLQVKNMMKRCKPVKSETGRFLSNGQSAKRGLNRSIADASWYGLTQKLEYLAVKSGKKLYKVNPKYTSQTCSKCRHVDKNSRQGEKFICTNCGHIDDANLQAARNV